VHEVVVHHHDIEADLVGGAQGVDRRSAAIDGDDEFGAALLQRAECAGGRAEAFVEAVGYIEDQLAAPGAEIAREDGRG